MSVKRKAFGLTGLLLLVAGIVLAQTAYFYNKTGTAYYGGTTAVPSNVATVVVTVWSDTAGTILDGTVVQVDTTTTSPTRIVVKGWVNTALTRPKILGLAYGNIPSSATGAPGKVLVMGYHGNAKMGASGLSANSLIKTNLSASGTLTTVADSVSGACGWFIGYNANTTAANNRGKVIITSPLGRFFGSL